MIVSPVKASDRIMEVQTMHNAPTTPAIPGWRLLISDAGRFWAFRNHPFPRVAVRVGAQSAVDADTFDEVKAAVAEQEEIAGRVAS
ncbi:hypothetical protein ACFQ08_06025 [Streptosporangium algeriense]|uniref:Uncharacterized protein n=1 Tax=Streptosporangium algeriense TaxID=1682748 RepID=A0ABW3DN83_9ACTN